MALSDELISELIKSTNARKTATTYDNTVYGTIVDDGENQYAKIDGSEGLTPIATTVELNDGDRVVVTIKNHTATVMGNTTSPAVGVVSSGNLRSIIDQQADQISMIVENQDTFTEFKQTIEGFSFMGGDVKISGGDLTIEFSDLSDHETIENKISAAANSGPAVLYSDIKSALKKASNTTKAMTIISEDGSIDTVDIYANHIYGGNFYAGTGSSMFANMSEDGFFIYHENNVNPKVMIGAIDDGATARLVLGAGSNNLSETASRLFMDKNDAMARLHFYDDWNNLCGFSFIRGSATEGSELQIQGTKIVFSGSGIKYPSSIDFSGVDSINWGSHAPTVTVVWG